jgi:hypothetical protein
MSFTPSGILRWSNIPSKTIIIKDIYKVVMRKRSICFLNQNHPFALDVYYNPKLFKFNINLRFAKIPKELVVQDIDSFRYNNNNIMYEEYNLIKKLMEEERVKFYNSFKFKPP